MTVENSRTRIHLTWLRNLRLHLLATPHPRLALRYRTLPSPRTRRPRRHSPAGLVLRSQQTRPAHLPLPRPRHPRRLCAPNPFHARHVRRGGMGCPFPPPNSPVLLPLLLPRAAAPIKRDNDKNNQKNNQTRPPNPQHLARPNPAPTLPNLGPEIRRPVRRRPRRHRPRTPPARQRAVGHAQCGRDAAHERADDAVPGARDRRRPGRESGEEGTRTGVGESGGSASWVLMGRDKEG
jgi:hypothetical protein